MGTITFYNHNITFNLKDKLLLKSFLTRVFSEERVPFISLSYVFCDDEYLLKLNQEYLNHDTLTDILTFTLSDPHLAVAGEIYISVERVKENAKELGCSFEEELHRVMIHGVLHLCGYSDETKVEKEAMRRKEDHYLAML